MGLILCAAYLMFAPRPVSATNGKANTFAIIVSRDLRPYLVCEQGVRQFLENWGRRSHKIVSMHLAEKDPSQVRNQITRMKPDMVICIGTKAAYLLRDMKPNYPWVATFIIDKTIEELKKTNGVIAVSMDVPIEKRISILCKIKDRVHAAVLARDVPASPKTYIKYGPCKTRNAYLQVFPFLSSIEVALQNILKNSINTFFITADPQIFNSQEVVTYTLLWGLRNRIAICGLSAGYVKNGALYALEADVRALGKQAAKLAIGCLLGKIKGDVVVQHPQKLILSINLKTASRLGLKIPVSILEKAQVVVK